MSAVTARFPIGKGTRLYMEVRKWRDALLRESLLVIDPSCGSESSQPGWAVYCSGKLGESGVLSIDPNEPLWWRLQALHDQLKDLVEEHQPSILIYEEISPRAWGGRAASGHASLLKAVGVTLGSTHGVETCIGIRPSTWKKLVRPTYRKSDEADAIEMGWVMLQLAAEIPAHRKKKTGGTK